MALYERWFLQYNDVKELNEDTKITVKKNILPGTKVWVKKPRGQHHLQLPRQKVPKNKSILFGKNKGGGILKNKAKPASKGKQIVETAQWQLVPVLSRSRDNITVKISTGFRVINLKDSADILPANSNITEDMTEMQFVHKPAILYNLKIRALRRNAYTYIGNVLISINPLRDVDSHLNFEPGNSENWPPHPRTVAERAFQKMAFSSAQETRLLQYDETSRRNTKLAPSKKSLTDKDSKFAQQYGLVNQSIVISGESGSGKTEASKRVLSQLVEREGYGDEFSDEDDPGVFDFQDNLIGTDPILESFGNAKTKRNPNSSRFGKFLQLSYDPPSIDPDEDYDNEDSFFIEEAKITTYLLERSRVTFHEAGEGNFRVFYQLLTAPNDAIQKHLGFTKAGRSFRYLKYQFNRNDHDRIGYRDLRIALSMVKIRIKAMYLFEVVAAVLHIGNIEIGEEDTPEGAVAIIDDPHKDVDLKKAAKEKRTRQMRRKVNSFASFTEGPLGIRETGSRIERQRRNTAMTRKSVASNLSGDTLNSGITQKTIIRTHNVQEAERQKYSPIRTACRLLKVSTEYLEKVLIQTQVKIGGSERITKRITKVEAEKRRDAIAKHIYGLLFDFIVDQLNKTLKRDSEHGDNAESKPFIGILDVFGFEEFETNSFEQLLINYTNEVLLALFAKEILVGESRIYKDEGLIIQEQELDGVADAIQAYDETLALFEGYLVGGKRFPGILRTIDSQQRVPKASDSKLLTQLQKQFDSNAYFVKTHPSKRDICFIVQHYASVVTYSIHGFLQKNDQSLPGDLEVFMSSSRHKVFKRLAFAHLPPEQRPQSVRRSKMRRTSRVSNVSARNRASRVKRLSRDKVNKNKKRASKYRKSAARGGKRAKRKNQTVCAHFSNQIEELRKTLLQTSCSYIRCVKPNPLLMPPPQTVKASGDEDKQDSRQEVRLKKTRTMQNAMQEMEHRKITFLASKKHNNSRNYFDEDYISKQLKNLGVYDCVNVLKAGLPTRIPYPTFLMTYSNMVTFDDIVFYKNRSSEFQQRTFVAALMKSYDVEASNYKLGRSKIFFKSGKLEDVKNILQAGGVGGGPINPKQKMRMLRHFNRFYCKKLWRSCIAKTQVAQYFLDDLEIIRAVLLLQRAFRKFLHDKKQSIKIQRSRAALTIQCFWRVTKAKTILALAQEEALKENIDLKGFGSTSRGDSKAPKDIETHWEELSMLDQEPDLESVELLSEVSQVGEFNALRTNLKSYFQRRTTYNMKTMINDKKIGKQIGKKMRTMRSDMEGAAFDAHRNDSAWSNFEEELMVFDGGDLDTRMYPNGTATSEDDIERLGDDSSSDGYSSEYDEEYDDDDDDGEVAIDDSDGESQEIGSFHTEESIMGGTVHTHTTGSKSKAEGTVDDMDIYSGDGVSTRRGTKATLKKQLTKHKRSKARASLASKRSAKSRKKKVDFVEPTVNKKRMSRMKLEGGKSRTNLPPVRRVSNIVTSPYSRSVAVKRPVNKLNPKKSNFWEKRDVEKALPPWKVKLKKVNKPTLKEKSDINLTKPKPKAAVDLNGVGIAARMAEMFGGSTLKRKKA